MNVLIVDDQQDVVNGIVAGVNWQHLHVGEVYEANSLREAQAVFNAHPVQILLCDIEMPLGSGIDLLAWVRENFPATECIFLTSHPSFEYAKAAIKLGSFDYLLQPAKYSDLEEVIGRAQAKIAREAEHRELSDYGSYWRDKQNVLLTATLRELLTEGWAQSNVHTIDLGRLWEGLGPDTPVTPVLIAVLRQYARLEAWEKDLLRYALHNVLEELSADKCEMIPLENGRYVAVLFTEDEDGIALVLKNFRTVCDKHLSCSLACYSGHSIPLANLHTEYAALLEMEKSNVARYSRVFTHADIDPQPEESGCFPQMKLWENHLRNKGWHDAVATEIEEYLASLVEKHLLTAEKLHLFHQEFARMFYRVADGLGIDGTKLYTSNTQYNYFSDAGSSAERMLEYVRHAVNVLKLNSTTPQDESISAPQVVETVLQYIAENLSREIPRQEIAEQVFLSADYVSRLFKKEMGVSLSDYIIGEKVKTAKHLLRESSLSVGVIASKVGYSNFSHFSQLFKRIVGETPIEYREKNRDNTK